MHADHGHPLPAPLGPRQRRAVQLCLGPDLGLEFILPERFRYGAAADQHEHWVDGGSGDQSSARAPDSE